MRKIKMSAISLLIVVISVFTGITVHATPQTRWTELSTLIYYMENTSSVFSNAKVGAAVNCYSPDSKITLKVTVQQLTSSGWVNTSKSWTTNNTGGAGIDKTVMLSRGNYRSRTDVTIYTPAGVYIETVTRYWPDIIIP